MAITTERNQSDAKKRVNIALILIIFATVCWGSQYLLIKIGTESIPTFLFQGLKNLIAFLGFAPFFKKLRHLNKEIVIGSLLVAITIYFMNAFISYGLQNTTSSKGAFIATLYVVMTPFFAWILLHAKIQVKHYVSVGLAVLGMAILMLFNTDSSPGGSLISIGDVLIFLCALFNAIQIVLVEKYVRKMDWILFAMTFTLFAALMLLLSSLVIGERFDFSQASSTTWLVWIYLGLIVGTVTLFIQTWGQRFIDSTRTAILFSLEPIFATVFGIIFADDPVTFQFFAGAALIMLAIIISSTSSGNKNK